MKKNKLRVIVIIIFAFTLGIVTSGLTISYAAETLSSKNIHYDNTNSGGSSTNVAGAIDELYATADDQDILKKEIIDTIYPVGSIYISTTDSTVEAVVARFGGTWEKYSSGRTLVGDDGTNYITNNSTKGSGGSKTVTLSTTNLPNHTHTTPSTSLTNGLAAEGGAHYHTTRMFLDQSGFSYEIPAGYSYYLSASGTMKFNSSTSILNANQWNIGYTNNTGAHTHTVTGTIPSMTTNSCTNCTSTPINVQDPYTVVYMYKRTA